MDSDLDSDGFASGFASDEDGVACPIKAAAAREIIAKGIIKKMRKILFMLDLIALPRIYQNLSYLDAELPGQRCFYSTPSRERMEKTLPTAWTDSHPEGQVLVEITESIVNLSKELASEGRETGRKTGGWNTGKSAYNASPPAYCTVARRAE